MHLNLIESFLPSFELPADWGPNPAIPRHHGQSSARHLHTFVPLPTEPRPPASLASHGGLPSHFVANPEPRFRAMSYRALLHADHGISRKASSAPPSPNDEIHIDEDRHPGHGRLAPRAKQASRSTLLAQLCILKIFLITILQPFVLPRGLEPPIWLNLSTVLALLPVTELLHTLDPSDLPFLNRKLSLQPLVTPP